jgi:ABC-type nitrate/sulfonate/bicarbonate transport system substrate-binding protein
MAVRIKSIVGILAAVTIASVASAAAQTPTSDTVRIGYQKSSTLTAILKTNGVLEKALAPLGVQVSWHEFTSGLPLLEAINTNNIDFGPCTAGRRSRCPRCISRNDRPGCGLGFRFANRPNTY